jgi:hypothetical protein
MSDGEECVRVGSTGITNTVERGDITAGIKVKTRCFNLGFRRMIAAARSACDISTIRGAKYQAEYP